MRIVRKLTTKILSMLPLRRQIAYIQKQLTTKKVPDFVAFKVADCKEEWIEAARIVHDAYETKGYSGLKAGGLRVTQDHLDGHAYFLIAKDTRTNKVVGTITINRNPFFMTESLKDDCAIELCSLALDPKARGLNIANGLFRYLFGLFLNDSNVKMLFAQVHPKEEVFYKALSFKRLSDYFYFLEGAQTVGLFFDDSSWKDLEKNSHEVHKFFSTPCIQLTEHPDTKSMSDFLKQFNWVHR